MRKWLISQPISRVFLSRLFLHFFALWVSWKCDVQHHLAAKILEAIRRPGRPFYGRCSWCFTCFNLQPSKLCTNLAFSPLHKLLSQIPYMDSCILKTLSANSWHVSLRFFQQNNCKQSGDEMLERLLISIFLSLKTLVHSKEPISAS